MLPVQIVCAVLAVFAPIIALTVISIAVEALFEHGADSTVLLYQVVAVNAPGMYPLLLFVPEAAEKPAVLLVVDDCHK